MERPLSETLASNLSNDGQNYLFAPDNLPALDDVADLRWKVLIDCDGEKVGTIETIEVDEDSGRVEFVEVGRGGFLGFGAERFLVPVFRIVQVEQKTVQIDRPAASLNGVPDYDPDRLNDPDYCEGIRSWWCESQQTEPEVASSGAE